MRPGVLPDPRGFTLVEVMIVVVLAAMIGFGLIGFYLNSQATWLDASSQAMTQRDATSILEAMAEEARMWPVADMPDSTHISFYEAVGLPERDQFYWDPMDSLVHHVEDGVERGPISTSIVERFCVRLEPPIAKRLVRIDTLRVRSSMGVRVQLSSVFALYNR